MSELYVVQELCKVSPYSGSLSARRWSSKDCARAVGSLINPSFRYWA